MPSVECPYRKDSTTVQDISRPNTKCAMKRRRIVSMKPALIYHLRLLDFTAWRYLALSAINS